MARSTASISSGLRATAERATPGVHGGVYCAGGVVGIENDRRAAHHPRRIGHGIDQDLAFARRVVGDLRLN